MMKCSKAKLLELTFWFKTSQSRSATEIGNFEVKLIDSNGNKSITIGSFRTEKHSLEQQHKQWNFWSELNQAVLIQPGQQKNRSEKWSLKRWTKVAII